MEILVILVVALVVVGPSKLPESGRQVGKALAEFRRWSSGVQSELRGALREPPPARPRPTASPTPEPPDGGTFT